MALPLKPIPSSFGIRRANALLLPVRDYAYFLNAAAYPFQGGVQHHSPVNAWWLADCALLVYEEQDVVESVLRAIPSTASGTPALNADSFRWLANAETGLAGFGIQSQNGSYAVLCFRGTEFYRAEDVWLDFRKLASSGTDLLQDTQIWTEIFSGPPGFDVPVVRGFYQPLQQIWPQLHNWINALPAGCRLWLTGHSLGAAIAVLLAHQLPERIAGVYTFGCPCPGLDDFATAYRKRGLYDKTYRYVHGNDLVAKVLQFGGSQYRHVGKEIVLTSALRRNWIERAWNRIVRRDITDHAPLYYALLCWNAIPD